MYPNKPSSIYYVLLICLITYSFVEGNPTSYGFYEQDSLIFDSPDTVKHVFQQDSNQIQYKFAEKSYIKITISLVSTLDSEFPITLHITPGNLDMEFIPDFDDDEYFEINSNEVTILKPTTANIHVLSQGKMKVCNIKATPNTWNGGRTIFTSSIDLNDSEPFDLKRRPGEVNCHDTRLLYVIDRSASVSEDDFESINSIVDQNIKVLNRIEIPSEKWYFNDAVYQTEKEKESSKAEGLTDWNKLVSSAAAYANEYSEENIELYAFVEGPNNGKESISQTHSQNLSIHFIPFGRMEQSVTGLIAPFVSKQHVIGASSEETEIFDHTQELTECKKQQNGDSGEVVKAFPNPSDGRICFQANAIDPDTKPYTVYVYTTLGNKVKSFRMESTHCEQFDNIGTYFYRVHTGKKYVETGQFTIH